MPCRPFKAADDKVFLCKFQKNQIMIFDYIIT